MAGIFATLGSLGTGAQVACVCAAVAVAGGSAIVLTRPTTIPIEALTENVAKPQAQQNTSTKKITPANENVAAVNQIEPAQKNKAQAKPAKVIAPIPTAKVVPVESASNEMPTAPTPKVLVPAAPTSKAPVQANAKATIEIQPNVTEPVDKPIEIVAKTIPSAPQKPESTAVAKPVDAPKAAEPQKLVVAALVEPEAKKQAKPIVSLAAKTPAPEFQLVRVEKDGSTVVAGKAIAGATVRIIFGGKVVDTLVAGVDGAFVSLITLPAGGEPQAMSLSQESKGETVVSEQTVLVVPPAKEQKSLPPKIVLASSEGATLIQPSIAETAPALLSGPSIATTDAALGLSIDTISYAPKGEVVLTGRGGSDQFVRVYVNNRAVETQVVENSGDWRVVLPDVDQGVYTLRVDEISPAGAVLARVESPFKREAPADVTIKAEQADSKVSVVVQPGLTLWALAEATYGEGTKYVQIFENNKDRIRDANLIYPGQVFDLPD